MKKSLLNSLVILLLSLFYVSQLYAQSDSASCNEYVNVINPKFNNLTATSSNSGFPLFLEHFSNKNNTTNSNLGDVSSWTTVLGGTAWLEVKDNKANGGNIYPAGSYAGFVINETDLISIGGSITITTFSGTTLQESKTNANVLGTLLDNGRRSVGFVTKKPFDRIRITINAGLTFIRTVNIYFAQVVKPCATAPLSCNVPTPLKQANNSQGKPGHGVIVEMSRSGLEGGAIGTFANVERVTDNDSTNFMTMSINIGVLASASISVRDLD
ncbi:MAG: hypothetical protein LC105_08025 [Chitinophagales bacterium]|nr:hypothetical protein [Chitinophagales bacterium]MCZ2393786.1 hypothetical protein [Chitinophagales bacterium]